MGIRKATKQETKQITEHALQVLHEASMGHIPPTQEKARQMVIPFLADGGYYLVYTTSHVLQGWIGIGHKIDDYTDEPVGIIPEIYVLPQYRHHGIAEQLCKEALTRLHEAGYRSVQLNVFAGNPMKAFYEKLGFNEVATLMERKFN